ncbi:hypothetical protein [Leptospira inadai]|uniref:Uncharacterized protein n=1 Tax=Leptospira inadai serovar Lyme TaxID=293084 RepID=A0ABX4YG37_9LEPT|nr:hypothetical protein [Leptospira inadai]PNV74042.1 hypothetical protein BES34_015950 [Leptospira inadai serovar Lyme]
MKKESENLPKIRTRFSGTVASVLTHRNPEQSRILIRDIRLLVSGRKIISAQDFYYSLRFRNLRLAAGDNVEFDARIRPDKKGVSSEKIRLNYPTKIFRKGGETYSLFPGSEVEDV